MPVIRNRTLRAMFEPLHIERSHAFPLERPAGRDHYRDEIESSCQAHV